MASQAVSGAFLSSAGAGMVQLAGTYDRQQERDFERRAELAKQDRLESFEIMKLQMGDQMSRSRLGLQAQLEQETRVVGAEATARYNAMHRVGSTTKLKMKKMGPYGLNVVEEYELQIQDRVDPEGNRTWWKFDPTELPTPMWRQISDAEHKKITADALDGAGDKTVITDPSATVRGISLDQSIRTASTDRHDDSGKLVYQGRPLVTVLKQLRAEVRAGTLPTVSMEDIDMLEETYFNEGLLEEDQIEGTWHTTQQVAGSITAGGTTMKLLRWFTPWLKAGGFGKAFAGRLVMGTGVGTAVWFGIEALLKTEQISLEELPGYWRNRTRETLDSGGLLDGLPPEEVIAHYVQLFSQGGRNMDYGQADGILEVLEERGYDTSSILAARDTGLPQESQVLLDRTWFQGTAGRVADELNLPTDGPIGEVPAYRILSVLTPQEREVEGIVEALQHLFNPPGDDVVPQSIPDSTAPVETQAVTDEVADEVPALETGSASAQYDALSERGKEIYDFHQDKMARHSYHTIQAVRAAANRIQNKRSKSKRNLDELEGLLLLIAEHTSST